MNPNSGSNDQVKLDKISLEAKRLLEAGDRRGFQELVYNNFYPYLVGLAVSKLGSKNMEWAEDVVADFFVKLLNNNRELYKGDSSLKTWLSRCIMFGAWDRIRKLNARKHFKHQSIDSHRTDSWRSGSRGYHITPEPLINRETPEYLYLEKYDGKKKNKSISEALAVIARIKGRKEENKLLDQKLIRMRFYEGMLTKDIASELGVKENTIKVRIWRIQRDLKRILQTMNSQPLHA